MSPYDVETPLFVRSPMSSTVKHQIGGYWELPGVVRYASCLATYTNRRI